MLTEPNIKLGVVTTFQHEIKRKSYIVKTQHLTSRNGLRITASLAQGGNYCRDQDTVRYKVHMTGFTNIVSKLSLTHFTTIQNFTVGTAFEICFGAELSP